MVASIIGLTANPNLSVFPAAPFFAVIPSETAMNDGEYLPFFRLYFPPMPLVPDMSGNMPNPPPIFLGGGDDRGDLELELLLDELDNELNDFDNELELLFDMLKDEPDFETLCETELLELLLDMLERDLLADRLLLELLLLESDDRLFDNDNELNERPIADTDALLAFGLISGFIDETISTTFFGFFRFSFS